MGWWSFREWLCVGVAVVVMGVADPVSSLPPSNKAFVMNQGYEDVVVGISPLLKESAADQIISSVKEAIRETSRALFVATGNRLFFRKVKILVPTTWNVSVDSAAQFETFEESHFRVDERNPVYGDQVYTVQPGGCGEPGKYVHITPSYLTNDKAEQYWGPRGKVLTQAWAQLRWGVFDEVGYPYDSRFPLFYTTWNTYQELVLRPNHCADKFLEGRYMDIVTGGNCQYDDDGMPDENCRFIPNEKETATSSLMSFTKLNSVDRFCEDVESEVRRHNLEAPNRHNLMCSGRSVWEVMMQHQDFFNTTSHPDDMYEEPEVLVVQQSVATFSLVLDYSGSMDGQKIRNLANTAKRWLLHDVADGGYVTIIRFSSSATTLKALTLVSNDTRQELADVITTSASGSTCIGCGLRLALEEMGNRTNKVIILITDGEENEYPYIKDVMDEVVESGSRVVTISYGKLVEPTLEILAQQTGGKAFIVPDDDDGSFMNDAFQGSLTYQPGQSITNTDIKIYEYDAVFEGEAYVNDTFYVDETLSRNLKLIIDTDEEVTTPSPPFLISPSGIKYEDCEFDSELVLWILEVEDAESGEWTWHKNTDLYLKTGRVTVTAQATDPEIMPIYTESWMNIGVDFVNASQQPVIVYASVTQGNKPVVGAKVRAYITTPDTSLPAVELDLLDNGQNADMQAGDGTYSRYYTQFVTTGRYAVKAQVWDEGDSYINNGFIASRRRRRRSYPVPLSYISFSTDEDDLVTNEYCCGSVVPFDPETATPTGDFTRNVAAGSFNVLDMTEGGVDIFPPARVLDLVVTFEDDSLTLNWTAPGDDYDTGNVTGYEVYMSNNARLLIGDFNETEVECLLDLETSSNLTDLLQEPGSQVTLVLNDVALKDQSVYFVALRAVDKAGNMGQMSYPVGVSLGTPKIEGGGGDGDDGEGLATWIIVVIVVVVILVVVIFGCVIYRLCCKKKKRNA